METKKMSSQTNGKVEQKNNTINVLVGCLGALLGGALASVLMHVSMASKMVTKDDLSSLKDDVRSMFSQHTAGTHSKSLSREEFKLWIQSQSN
tara:strand:- start:3954 stop:4232 length:279 start_codon:yes stop_codon:yes gene_type:complete